MEKLSILVSTDNGTFEEFYLFMNNCLIISLFFNMWLWQFCNMLKAIISFSFEQIWILLVLFVLVHQDVLNVIWFAMTWINPNVDIDGWMLMQFLVDYMWYFISIFHNVSYSSKFQVNLFRLKNKNKNFTFVQFNISNDFVICIMFGNG